MSEPTTEAGRAHLNWLAAHGADQRSIDLYARDILAIEREAYAKVRAAVVHGDFGNAWYQRQPGGGALTELVVKDSVLAAIDALMGDDDGR